MRRSVALIAAALLLPQLAVHAQEKKDSGGRPTYKVELNVRDNSDPAAKAGRHYMLLMDAGRKTVLKMGVRVPVATSASVQPGTDSSAINPLVSTQYQYIDAGVSIECLLHEVDGRIAITGDLNFVAVMERDGAARAANPSNPTLNQTRLDLDAAVEPGKPTVIAAIDDAVNARQFQVEATVTRVQ